MKTYAELAARIHKNLPPAGGEFGPEIADVLWPRRAAEDSPFGRYLAALRSEREKGERPREERSWTYDPASALREAREGDWLADEKTGPWTAAVVEMSENAIRLNEAVVRARSAPDDARDPDWQATAEAWPVPVRTGEDRAGEFFAWARAGANGGKSTKSNVTRCPHPDWQEVCRVHGLRGFISLPVVTLGSHGFGLQSLPPEGWEPDYITLLLYLFYLDYNADTLGGSAGNSFTEDMARAMNYPDLPYNLRLSRLYIMCDMAFFDAKRKAEALFRQTPTAGAHAWVFRNRDRWRDYKAADSSMFSHYLWHAPGLEGRNDLMMSGVTNDWLDLGPDLRYSESGNSVLTLTRGSIACADLLDAYERTLWMLNDHWTDEGDIKADRYTGCVIAMSVGLWGETGHRHDVWRYYASAFDVCEDATRRNLQGVVGLLADCYTESFELKEPRNIPQLAVPRDALDYDILVGGHRHTGTVHLHRALVKVVDDGRMPKGMVEYMLVLPLLLRQGRVTPEEFLDHMDQHYCTDSAMLTHTLHANNFDREVGVALSALVMEQWWSGFFYAVGIGSLIEAQPGQVANDRLFD
jgi:hypothetical protein